MYEAMPVCIVPVMRGFTAGGDARCLDKDRAGGGSRPVSAEWSHINVLGNERLSFWRHVQTGAFRPLDTLVYHVLNVVTCAGIDLKSPPGPNNDLYSVDLMPRGESPMLQ